MFMHTFGLTLATVELVVRIEILATLILADEDYVFLSALALRRSSGEFLHHVHGV